MPCVRATKARPACHPREQDGVLRRNWGYVGSGQIDQCTKKEIQWPVAAPRHPKRRSGEQGFAVSALWGAGETPLPSPGGGISDAAPSTVAPIFTTSRRARFRAEAHRSLRGHIRPVPVGGPLRAATNTHLQSAGCRWRTPRVTSLKSSAVPGLYDSRVPSIVSQQPWTREF